MTAQDAIDAIDAIDAGGTVQLMEALSWALDMIDMADTRLVELGDPPDLVYSAVHLGGKAKARAALAAAPTTEHGAVDAMWLIDAELERLRRTDDLIHAGRFNLLRKARNEAILVSRAVFESRLVQIKKALTAAQSGRPA